MKYIKYFENSINFEVGDYVLYHDFHRYIYPELEEYLKYNIGEIIYISSNFIYIKYLNIPENLKHLFKPDSRVRKYIDKDDGVFILNITNKREIRIATQEDIEKCKIKNDSNKYNL